VSRPTRRALLVHPGVYNDGDQRAFPPWGVLSVGSSLREAGVDVVVEDLNGLDAADAIVRLAAKHDPDFVGFTCKLGLAAKRFRTATDALRAEFPSDLRVVAGGPLVSSFPDPSHPLWRGVDALFLGDGETALVDWVSDGMKRCDAIIGPSEVRSLDHIDWGLWWPSLIEYVWPADAWPNMAVPGIHVASARGCTRRCTFCYLNSNAPGTRFRYVTSAVLYHKLQLLRESLGPSGFYFIDDCFIDRRRDRVNEFVALNRSDGAPFRFGCDIQLPDLEDIGMLKHLYAAGFRCFYLGIEAASASVRKRLAKGSTSYSIKYLVERALDMGFLVRASIGIGWPGETVDDMKATLALIDSIPKLAFDAYKFLPLPNTPIGESSFWASRRQKSPDEQRQLEEAYCDYSAYNDNYSSAEGDQSDALWLDLRQREQSRLRGYATGFSEA
jgi:radical SAM superfamily enzyme YgiQ (UPF0313 family)